MGQRLWWELGLDAMEHLEGQASKGGVAHRRV